MGIYLIVAIILYLPVILLYSSVKQNKEDIENLSDSVSKDVKEMQTVIKKIKEK